MLHSCFLHCLHHSDQGFLIRLEGAKDSETGKEKDKDKDKDNTNPSVSYSHSALPVSSEAVSLFRFLLRTEDWKALVEQTLLRPLVDMTERIRTFQVSTYISYITLCQILIFYFVISLFQLLFF